MSLPISAINVAPAIKASSVGSAMSSAATANLFGARARECPPRAFPLLCRGLATLHPRRPSFSPVRSSRDAAILDYGGQCGLDRLFADHRFVRHAGRTDHWIKVKNPAAPAVKREAEEDWARR